LSQKKFKNILVAAVEEGLSSLGDSSKEAILFHLETSFKIKKERIPENLQEFEKALEAIFGPGTQYLEKVIVRCLYEKLGLEFKEEEDCSLLKDVEQLKKRVLVTEDV
jgi:hypothetical protein